MPSEYQKTVKSILSEIRYDSRKEDNLRQQPETTYSRAKDAIRKGIKEYGGKHENAKSNELSSEERRIIGEYFPEFNKSEETVMKAPNGKDSKLTKDQWNLAENASKVIDSETGEPMLVYHGTISNRFSEFNDKVRKLLIAFEISTFDVLTTTGCR